MSISVQSWWSLVGGILPICTQSRENAIESVWLQPVAQRALAFLHIDSSRIYHRSSCRTPTMTVETSWSSSLRSKYVSCLHRRSCLVYAHQEEWALITCSLVPRPHPVFSMLHADKRFSACNIEKLGYMYKVMYCMWGLGRPTADAQCICACALGVSHPAHTTIQNELCACCFAKFWKTKLWRCTSTGHHQFCAN